MPVKLTLSSEGLADGEYHAWILIGDNHFHEWVIPVTLVVDTYLHVPGKTLNLTTFSASPNPFFDKTWLQVKTLREEKIRIEIMGMDGQVVNCIEAYTGNGQNTFLWDARGLPAGCYMARITTAGEVRFVKIVKGY